MLSVEHRGAVLEISRGLSDRRERYPRNMATKKQGTLEGCQTRPSTPPGSKALLELNSGGIVALLLNPRLISGSPPGCKRLPESFLDYFTGPLSCCLLVT